MNNENVVDHPLSIDWQLSITLAGGDKKLAKDLLEMYIADLPRSSEAIHAAHLEKQYGELLNQVHRLHGASCYCGVTRLKSILSNMEFAAREKQTQQFEDALHEFDEEVNNVMASYKMVSFA
ncbi:MAG: Hpt domain-containing protein [Gammaproteobacteria bacterium]|nr:Hpt domain-containing protein [Gammaproteobacteria bacterium]